jgi:Fe2+ transport system protein B
MKKELRSGWATIGIVAMQCLVAWMVAFVVYQIGGLLL